MSFLNLKESKTVTTTIYECYSLNKTYCVEINKLRKDGVEFYDVWIWKKHCCRKEYVIGVPAIQQSFEELIEIIERELETNFGYYLDMLNS